jgi:hypothetical protein
MGDEASDRGERMNRVRGPEKKPTTGSTLAGSTTGGERRPGFRAAGLAASRLAAPIVARHGGGILARLKAEWIAIAGAEPGESSWPDSLAKGVLKLRIAPARALEVQHRAPLLIERINLFFGRTVVTRLVLVQGPLPLVPSPTRPRPEPLPSSASAALVSQVAEIADPELRAALAKLGHAVFGSDRRGG